MNAVGVGVVCAFFLDPHQSCWFARLEVFFLFLSSETSDVCLVYSLTAMASKDFEGVRAMQPSSTVRTGMLYLEDNFFFFLSINGTISMTQVLCLASTAAHIPLRCVCSKKFRWGNRRGKSTKFSVLIARTDWVRRNRPSVRCCIAKLTRGASCVLCVSVCLEFFL